MELRKFKDNIYGKLGNQLFLWDSTWELFRPIDTIAWDGYKIVTTDSFRNDIFDPYYGFGSVEMKEKCIELSENIDLEAPEILPWIDSEWWRDRKCTFTECAPKDSSSWIRYIKYTNSKAKTLRVHRQTRATKRLLPN